MTRVQNGSIIYEYPLQERFRTYLRLEHSFNELENALALADNAPNAFFSALFATQELVERNDIKTELSKDLELQRNMMMRWQQHPQIDQNALQGALHSITMAADGLQDLNRDLKQLKEDRFLATIRSRFIQPSVTGLFELPQLQLWLSQPGTEQQAHQQRWFDAIKPLAAAIDLQLELTRQQGEFEASQARSGFWQETCEPLALLRVKLPVESLCYPVVSGHRQRFSLRFMSLPSEGQQTDAIGHDVNFSLARSPLLTNTSN